MPPIGNNYEYVYGYAQEHHTVELYMRLWKTHDIDVVRNGTPPPFSKIIEATCSGWNKCMGNVDTVRKTLGYHKVKRGSNTKPGFLVWYTFFNYILYNLFRVYSYYLMEKKLGEFVSFKQFQDRRKHMLSFKDFLDDLCCRDSFGISQFDKYYPGLKEKFDQFKLFPTQLRQRKEQSEQKMEDEDEVDNDDSGDTTNARVYKALEKVID